MYPYSPSSTSPSRDLTEDEPTMTDLRGVLPGQRPPMDPTVLEEPTSEVPVIRPAAGTEETDAEAEAGPESDAEPDADSESLAAAESEAGADAAELAEPTVEVDSDAAVDTEPIAESEEQMEMSTTGQPPAAGNGADLTPPVSPLATPPVVAFGSTPTAETVEVEPEPEPTPGLAETPIALWSDADVERLHDQWRDLQVQFFDDPAAAMAGAKSLVTETVQELANTLQAAHDQLDPYRESAPVDTETMRLAMRRYREFLDRVLAL